MSEYIDYRMGDYLGEYIMEIRDDDSGLIKEQIVRCKDCAKSEGAYVHLFDGSHGKALECVRFESFRHMTDPDGFCKWGKPK